MKFDQIKYFESYVTFQLYRHSLQQNEQSLIYVTKSHEYDHSRLPTLPTQT